MELTFMQSPQQIKSRLFSLLNKGIKYDLTRMYQAAALRGDPQKSYVSIHVAGTNGKGSTCACVESILRRAGYKTGLYTSPHITDFEERFRIDGVDIDENTWFGVYKEQEKVINDLNLTFFEAATLMAFEIFKNAGVEYAVFETGMGGRLDATNIITPAVSVITKLALDHREYLGGSIDAIAGEKLGIVKPGVPLVMLEPDNRQIKKLAVDKCAELDSELTFAGINADDIICGNARGGVSFDYDNHRYDLSLFGAHQAQNALLALNAVKKTEIFRLNGIAGQARNDGSDETGINEQQILYDGLKSATLAGRFQIFDINGRAVVMDVGHNPDAMEVLVAALEKRFSGRRVSFILGMMADKDTSAAINVLSPRASAFYFTRPNTERAAAPRAMVDFIDAKFGGKLFIVEDVGYAVNVALDNARGDDVICVTGSFYTVSEAMRVAGGVYC
ncbi:MAG: bifunctional folylpolyglutamate synthase/dihydrofolate synthase [Chitinispirillales bacterium]|jgi:dihydrofolate synthase/folylpolyglutamate synthase|nr:bifunctional folylpolyglutamate synthase/dihydrofolate synthase [Chitinispirillales bacterium]